MLEVIITIGPSGCGKSHEYQTEYKDTHFLVSSDKIRKQLYGDESIQDNPAKVFEIAHTQVLLALEKNKNVYFDATNLQRKFRVQLVQKIHKYCKELHIECRIIYMLFAARIDWCIGNDAIRDRHVGADVIINQLRKFDVPVMTEGYDELYIERQGPYYDSDELNEKMRGFNQDSPYHTKDLLEHCDAVRLPLAKSGRSNFSLRAYLHDIGKLYTKSFTDSKGRPSGVAHYYGHERVGAYMVLSYRYFMDWTEKIEAAYLTYFHMMPYFTNDYRKKITDLLGDDPILRYGLLDDIETLHKLDEAAH